MSGSVQNIGNVTLSASAISPTPANLETFLLALCADRSNLLNAVAQGQASDMQKTNEKIAKLNSALNELRSKAPGEDKNDKPLNGSISADTKATLAANGITLSDFVKSDNKLTGDGAMQRMMESVKTQIDTLSSTSQLDMIKLQGMINKSNQSVEMMTNLVQKFAGTKDKIIGNMR